eukprot:Skav234847  [mRNA]  locus=scaffold1355:118365:122921:+ [translate_table: standard]
MDSLQLEIPWSTVAVGQKISVQANQVIFDSTGKRHLFRSVVFGQFFTVEGDLKKGFAYTFLDAEVVRTGRPHLSVHSGYSLPLDVPTFQAYSQVCEVCSGIGIMAEGLESGGVEVIASNELRPPFCEFQRAQGRKNVIQGDINESSVIARLHQACPGPTMVTVGFACQPWSRLGDRQHMNDARSGTMQASLRYSYYTRAPLIIMECVEEAGKDEAVQAVIKAFCKQTGYRATQVNLALSNLMPIRRNRWWCVLANPSLPPLPLEPLPCTTEPVCLGHMFPFMPTWETSHLDQLLLDSYETRKYYQFGNMAQLLISSDTVLPTALHGWSNQLGGCPCGCRSWPLSEARLESKGLHGALLAIGGTYETEYSSMLKTRFLHPWELALVHGCLPNKDWGASLRLAIAGLGQQASPIQSCWIFAQFRSHYQAAEGEPVTPPEATLWNHFGTISLAVQETCPQFAQHEVFQAYLRRIHDTLHASVVNKLGPCPVFHTWDTAQPQPLDDVQMNASTETNAVIEVESASHHSPPSPNSGHAATQLDPGLGDTESVTGPEDPAGNNSPAGTEEPQVSLPPSGGIVGFQSQSRTLTEAAPSGAVESGNQVPLTQAVAQTIDIIDPPTSHSIMLFRFGDGAPVQVVVPKDATVGSITVAEERLRAMAQPIQVHTTLGIMVPLAERTQPMQQVFLRELRDVLPSDELPNWLASRPWECRSALLYHQNAFVADDEMNVYLQIIGNAHYAASFPACVIQPWDYDDRLGVLETWVRDYIPNGENATAYASAILMDNHWSPVLLVACTDGLHVYITPNMEDMIKEAFGSGNIIAQYHTIQMHSAFPNDCGFQTVAWLIEQILDTGKGSSGDRVPTMAPDTAVMWRALFEHHLHESKLDHFPIPIGTFAFGGAGGELEDQLQSLLSHHGVDTDAVVERAQNTLEKLGRGPVARALRTSRAWAELKALANAATPRLQLVLPSELAAVIATRVKQGEKFGDKKTKSKQDRQVKPRISFSAEDVSVPLGIFKEEGGSSLKQISIHDIGPHACGVILVDSSQAAPYLKRTQPVSSGGLAMLIIDHHDVLLTGVGQELRFPVKCNKTQEPMLISCRVVQLGQKAVVRMTPENSVKVGEVTTNVFRAVVFADDLDTQWSRFIQSPVKYIIEHTPALQTPKDVIIDCWDRQFLSDKLTRSKPVNAYQFTVSFRVQDTDIHALLKQSGTNHVYYEPRSIDGRSPDEAFRVIWLGKRDKTESTLALQGVSQWACLVRVGARYGVRVKQADSEAVHGTLKPNLPFLQTQSHSTYLVGPLPFGATRNTISALFKSWKWAARPSQPRYRSVCAKGMIWEIHAATAPEYDVYQCQHADVLISVAPTKETRQKASSSGVQASSKTIQALTIPREKSVSDPWLQDDPWKGYSQPAKHQKLSPALSADQVQAIASQVEQKVLSNVHPKEAEMEVDSQRVELLEERLTQVEQKMQANFTQQSIHNQEVANRINHVQNQVEQQGLTMRQHFDQRLTEQLQQIESIINKQRKTE